MSRPTLVAALALQLFTAIAPANAFIICMSDDGCVELEAAAPGATRCPETDCDSEHAGTSHDCRDIPVLIDAVGLKAIPAIDTGLLPIALAPAWQQPADVVRQVTPIQVAAAPRHAPPPRTVVLQL